jgi:hypothetical protein
VPGRRDRHAHRRARGAVKAGAHEFVIDVPDATFAGGQGDFPFSLYVQAQ